MDETEALGGGGGADQAAVAGLQDGGDGAGWPKTAPHVDEGAHDAADHPVEEAVGVKRDAHVMDAAPLKGQHVGGMT